MVPKVIRTTENEELRLWKQRAHKDHDVLFASDGLAGLPDEEIVAWMQCSMLHDDERTQDLADQCLFIVVPTGSNDWHACKGGALLPPAPQCVAHQMRLNAAKAEAGFVVDEMQPEPAPALKRFTTNFGALLNRSREQTEPDDES